MKLSVVGAVEGRARGELVAGRGGLPRRIDVLRAARFRLVFEQRLDVVVVAAEAFLVADVPRPRGLRGGGRRWRAPFVVVRFSDRCGIVGKVV